jgi:hypothetical protein
MGRKSVTIRDGADSDSSVDVQSPLTPSAAMSPPARSALKRNEDVKLVIRSADPIGQDTAVYEFTRYAVPAPAGDDDKASASGLWPRWERALATRVAQSSVLLGRSSGRDKLAATIQYFALFWGSQPFLDVSGIADGPSAPWRLLEESMSNGRKVFRLGKWIKEYEKARLALTAPDAYIGVIPGVSARRAMVTRVLAVLMNAFSCSYYLWDNIVWAAQTGLINRAPHEGDPLLKLLSATNKLPYDKYMQLMARHREVLADKAVRQARVDRWKDYKNYSSLARLVLAMLHSTLQILSLRRETARLITRYQERLRYAAGETDMRPVASPSRASASTSPNGDGGGGGGGGGGDGGDGTAARSSSGYALDRYDSLRSIEQTQLLRVDVTRLARQRDQRLQEVADAITEHRQELVACAGNLGILLNRLKFPLFDRMPLWVVGVLGVVASGIGCMKNWPSFVPEPKPEQVAKRRSESLDKTDMEAIMAQVALDDAKD